MQPSALPELAHYLRLPSGEPSGSHECEHRRVPGPMITEGTTLGVTLLVTAMFSALSLNGKVYRTFPRNPGEKAPLHKANDKIIGPILQDINLFDFSAPYVRRDAEGRYFLYYDGKDSWRVATNRNGTDTTTVLNQVANRGTFWMFGTYDLPMVGPLADGMATVNLLWLVVMVWQRRASARTEAALRPAR